MKRYFISLLTIAVLSVGIFSCKKTSPKEEVPVVEEPSTEEIFLMNQVYENTVILNLWTSSLPQPAGGITSSGSFSPAGLRAFTKKYSSAEAVLDALVTYTPKIGPGATAVDRYSFIDREGQVGEEIGQGVYRNIGVGVRLLILNANNDVGVFISYVLKNSPAETIGLKRGLQVESIDGQAVSLKVNASGSVEGNISLVNKLFSGDVSTLAVWDRTANNKYTATIPNVTSYVGNPILATSIIENQANNKKIGYLAYNSFVSVLSSQKVNDATVLAPNAYHNDLVSVFENFASSGINELVIDLRYNGGGATNAAELLTNLIIPTGNNGQIMYKYAVNNYLGSWGWTESTGPFAPVYVNKTNSLSLPRVYFLVTSSSASASELVINSLKPYMNVQVISINNRGTYGKPVGSFGFPVELSGKKLADLYITSFKMVNKNNEGDYYGGLAGNKQNSIDDILIALGSPEEEMLSDALYHAVNGSYRTSSGQQSRISRLGQAGKEIGEVLDYTIGNQVQGLYNLEINSVIKK